MQMEAMKAQYAWYVRNCARSTEAAALQGILMQQLLQLDDTVVTNGGCDCPACLEEAAGERFKGKTPRQRLQRLHRMLERYSDTPASDECFEQNTLFARDEFALDQIDVEILLLILRYERNPRLERLADGVAHVMKNGPRAAAMLIGAETRTVLDRLKPGSPLVDQGIVALEEDETAQNGLAGRGGRLRLSPPMRRVMHRPFSSREEWANAIIGPALTTPLDWEDFEHLGAERDFAARLLRGATSGHAEGLNLLLHGPVGTGKTEFCKALARQAGCTLWSIGEKDQEGGEPSRGERLAGLRLAQRLLKGRANAVLLFDEAEDILARPGGFMERHRDESKVFVNRIMEGNRVPVLWTCNDVEQIHAAVLRRMTLALEVKTPNRSVRERIWRRVIKSENLAITDEAVRQLAARYETPPAVAATAARATALAGGGAAEIEQAMVGVLRVLGIGPSVDDGNRSLFDLALINCDTDLDGLVEQLGTPGMPTNWSLCIHGAPGTGKSQYARYLADRLGMEVMQQRASDLLSKWVGDSEKQIAGAFATARRQRAMLIIDEADSLLLDRRDALRSWEVSQVNEMLTWMENHPLPFVCTTNLMDRLDQASLRRFTLKLRFNALSREQAARAFERFFGIPAPYLPPEGLTPGDFATVRRKCELFRSAEAGRLMGWLKEEAEAKGAVFRPIGFHLRQSGGS